MRILLTNDDGLMADGLQALYRELKKFAQVTVVAPDSERSSVGQAITLTRPLWIKKIKMKDRHIGYGISGTPTDCVKLAVKIILKRKPDLIISGINQGPNDGCSVFYSGTVAAAREGALIGIPSFALSVDSLNPTDFRPAAHVSVRIIKTLIKIGMPPKIFFNINIPSGRLSNCKGIRMTRQGRDPIHGDFKRYTNPYNREYYWMLAKTPLCKDDLAQDTYALANRYITVTPLHCDSTAQDFLDKWSTIKWPKL